MKVENLYLQFKKTYWIKQNICEIYCGLFFMENVLSLKDK